MTDRGIIMSGPMVRALLDGRKTQTRRLAWQIGDYPNPSGKVETLYIGDGGFPVWRRATPWQKVKLGDRLYVREAFTRLHDIDPETDKPVGSPKVYYRADRTPLMEYDADREETVEVRWKPSIHMPKKLSRLTFVVTEVKLERVQEISEADALAEGVDDQYLVQNIVSPPRARVFGLLIWNALHKPGNRWEDNPAVVALTFETHRCNIDRMAA